MMLSEIHLNSRALFLVFSTFYCANLLGRLSHVCCAGNLVDIYQSSSGSLLSYRLISYLIALSSVRAYIMAWEGIMMRCQ